MASDGALYFPSEDGDVFVVRAGASYELLAHNPIGEILMASPAISEGTLFVRGRHHLFALAASSDPDRADGGLDEGVR